MTKRQEICECGKTIGNIFVRTNRLEELLGKTNIEECPHCISAAKGSMDFLYDEIKNIERSCTIDTRKEQNLSLEAHNKIAIMSTMKDSAKLYENKNDVLNNLNKIKYSIMEKIKECSRR